MGSDFWTSQRKGYGARKSGARAARDYGERGVQDSTSGDWAGGQGAEMLAQRYRDTLLGRGSPSVAELQTQRMYGQAMQGAMGLAAGSGASNRAGSRRAGIMAGGRLAGEAAGAGAITRATEQNMAAQGLGGLIGQQQQHALGLEGIMAQNYATQMGQLQERSQGWGSQILGGLMSAGGAALGGVLSGGAGGIGGALAGGAAAGASQGIAQGLAQPGAFQLQAPRFGGG